MPELGSENNFGNYGNYGNYGLPVSENNFGNYTVTVYGNYGLPLLVGIILGIMRIMACQ